MTTRFVHTLWPAVAVVVLAACSSNEPTSDPPATSAISSPSASSSPRATSTTPPVPVVPADGEDLLACADGTCEVRVITGVTVPLPEDFGVGPLTVTAIDAAGVTMASPLTRSQFAVDGTCSAGITGAAANAPAHVDMTCAAGSSALVNTMHLEVASMGNQSAVIRIRPGA